MKHAETDAYPKENVDVKVDDDNSVSQTTEKANDLPSKQNDLAK